MQEITDLTILFECIRMELQEITDLTGDGHVGHRTQEIADLKI